MSRVADILIQQGQNAARAREQSGAIWGGAVQQLGQIPGQVMAQRAQQQAYAQKAAQDADAQQLAHNRDRRDAASAEGEATDRLARLEKMRQAQAEEEADKLRASDATGDDVKAWITQRTGKLWMPDEAEALIARASEPDGHRKILDFLAPVRQSKAAEPFTLGEGQVRFDPQGNQIAEGPKKIEKPTAITYGQPTTVTVGGKKMLARPASDGSMKLIEGMSPEPDKPKDERIVQVMGDKGTPIWVRESDAVGKPAAQAPRAVTGAERGVLAYYNRAKEAVETLTSGDANSLESRMAKQGLAGQAQLKQPFNLLQTGEQQQYRQAQRAFTEARLRKESGAAIPVNEYDNDAKTYFAQPGDDPKTIEQKRKARDTVLEGLKFSSGKAYDEFYGEPNISSARGGAKPKDTDKSDPLGLRK